MTTEKTEPSTPKMTSTDASSEQGTNADVQTPATSKRLNKATLRQTLRTTEVVISSARELGALLRIARQRLDMTQAEAAVCCGVGRRFYVELENGKPTVQLDKVFVVLEALGITLAVGGPGAAFTPAQLSRACLKQEEGEAPHVWQASFSSKQAAPFVQKRTKTHPGRRNGSVEQRFRDKVNRVKTDKGIYDFDPETGLMVQQTPPEAQ